MGARGGTLGWLLIVVTVLAVAVVVGVRGVELLDVDQRPDLPLGVRVTGAVVALLGAALGIWTFVYHPPVLMARVTAKTIEIALRKLPPQETAVPKLITAGPYRLVRNPTYLSVFLVLVGLAVALPLLGLLASALLMMVWWNVVMIPPEERELEARFGDAYVTYRGRPWRFVPRMR